MKSGIAAVMLVTSMLLPLAAQAEKDPSAELSEVSTLPVASVLITASALTVAIPVALSVGGARLVVKGVEASAKGTVYVLERVSDGASVSVEVVAKGAKSASLAVGSAVTTSVIGAGVVLSVAGEAIAFIPNELGMKLLHNEQVSH